MAIVLLVPPEGVVLDAVLRRVSSMKMPS